MFLTEVLNKFFNVINFLKRVYRKEDGFLETILGAIAGPLISGLFGGGAAAPATQAAESSAGAQSAMINMLMDMYKNVFGPAQTDIMGQYMGLAGAAPTQDIVTFQLLQDLLPTMMPDILRSKAEYGVRRGAERQTREQREALTRRGITGPAAERLLGRIGEEELTGLSKVSSDIGAWEAEQTLANRGKAYDRALQLLGLAGQFSSVGSAFPGTAITGAGDLTRTFMQSAAAARQPWEQVGTSIGDIMKDWFTKGSYPSTSPAPAPTPAYTPSPQIPDWWNTQLP